MSVISGIDIDINSLTYRQKNEPSNMKKRHSVQPVYMKAKPRNLLQNQVVLIVDLETYH